MRREYRFNEDIELVPFGDTHLGNDDCDEEAVWKTVDYILADENRYTVLMGDIIETTVPEYPGFFDTRSTFEEQVEKGAKLIEALKGRILGILVGNHELRVWKSLGLDILKFTSSLLDAGPVDTSLYLDLFVGKQRYRVYAVHGGGRASTPTGKLNRAIRMTQFVDADIYLLGHVHVLNYLMFPIVVPEEEGERPLKNGLSMRYRYIVYTGAYLPFPRYAQLGGLGASAVGSPVIRLGSQRRSVNIDFLVY